MHRRVEEHFEALRACVATGGGTVFATMGDGIAASFTSASAAVQAAVSAQQMLAAIGLRVRMGVHSGAAERVSGDFRGPAVNRAARLMGLGHGGQILVSDAVAAAFRHIGAQPIRFVDLGVYQLRDLTESEHVWRVAHPSLERRFGALRSAPPAGGSKAERATLVLREDDATRVLEFVRQNRVLSWTEVAGLGPAGPLASDVDLDETKPRSVVERVRFEIDVELVRTD